jgi:hypothetical protein
VSKRLLPLLATVLGSYQSLVTVTTPP